MILTLQFGFHRHWDGNDTMQTWGCSGQAQLHGWERGRVAQLWAEMCPWRLWVQKFKAPSTQATILPVFPPWATKKREYQESIHLQGQYCAGRWKRRYRGRFSSYSPGRPPICGSSTSHIECLDCTTKSDQKENYWLSASRFCFLSSSHENTLCRTKLWYSGIMDNISDMATNYYFCFTDLYIL